MSAIEFQLGELDNDFELQRNVKSDVKLIDIGDIRDDRLLINVIQTGSFATQLAKCEFPLKLGEKQISDCWVELELSRSEIAEALLEILLARY